MTLREYLRICKNNVKIGAKCGFFYCGVPNEDTTQRIDADLDKFKNRYKKELEDKKNYLNNFDKIWEIELRRRGTEVINQHRDTPELMEEIRREWEIDKDKAHKEALNKKEWLTKYVKNWKDLLDRDIIEIYDSIDCEEPQGTKIVIIDGAEKECYWTTKEYMKANGK